MSEWARIKKSTITGIGDAIREKEGSSDLIPTSQMKRRILDIKSGTDTSDATATSEDILLGKTAYVNDVKVVGTIEEYDGEQVGGIEENLPTDLSYMFYNNTNITSLDKFCIDWYKYTSNAQTTRSMFYGCSKLTAIPKLSTSNVKTCISMFYDCSNLTIIQSLDLKNVDNMQDVFYGCSKLTAIPKLSTPKVTQFTGTFCNCRILPKIDISHFNISNHYSGKIYSQNMCANCYSLKTIIIRSFGSSYLLDSTSFSNCYHLTGTTDSTYNPTGAKDGYIYVPRNMVDTLKSATNWSAYADQIRALEDYTVDGTTTGELDESKI